MLTVPCPPVVRCIAVIIDELSTLGGISWSSAEVGFLGEVAKSDASKTLTWSNPTAMLFVSAVNPPQLLIFAIFSVTVMLLLQEASKGIGDECRGAG